MGSRCGVVAQVLDVAADGRRCRLQLGRAGLVELEVGRVDDHVGARELAQLSHLDRRPGGLHRPAAADDEDLADPGCVDRLDCGVGGVGGGELLGGERQHARDVEGDVAVPDHDRPLAGEVEREVLEVGMAVVPGDERRGRPGSGQVLAGDPELAVGLRADGVDDRVVEARELGVLDVLADLDVAEEAEARLRGGSLEGPRDGLDVRVVGRDAEPYEPPRRRQPLDQVHLDLEVACEQRRGSVEPSRAGADDSDPKAHAGDARALVRAAAAAAAGGVSGVVGRSFSALLDGERVAAAARGRGVRVVDLEPGLLEAVQEVDRRALEVRGAVGVDHDRDAVLLERLVVLDRTGVEAEPVLEAGAPAALNRDAQDRALDPRDPRPSARGSCPRRSRSGKRECRGAR